MLFLQHICRLTNVREVLGFRWYLCVEFCHWDASGCNPGAKHGCWVNNRRCAHLQVNNDDKVYRKTFLVREQNKTKPQLCYVILDGGRRTYHQTEVTELHLLFYLRQDMRVQSFAEKHHIGPQQTMAISFLTPSYKQQHMVLRHLLYIKFHIAFTNE